MNIMYLLIDNEIISSKIHKDDDLIFIWDEVKSLYEKEKYFDFHVILEGNKYLFRSSESKRFIGPLQQIIDFKHSKENNNIDNKKILDYNINKRLFKLKKV